MAGCYRYGNRLSGCIKACGSLTVWAFISPINFSRKTELTALTDKLPFVYVCLNGRQMIKRHSLVNREVGVTQS